MDRKNLKNLGERCKNFRKDLRLKQSEVAADLGCSVENVSAFENGRNGNLQILLWYVKKGFKVE